MLNGLGAFVRGGMDGYRFGEGIDDRQAARDRQERLDGIAEEERARRNRRQDESDQWRREDREYLTGQRDWLDNLYEDAARMTDDEMSGPSGPSGQTETAGLGARRPVQRPDGVRVSTREAPQDSQAPAAPMVQAPNQPAIPTAQGDNVSVPHHDTPVAASGNPQLGATQPRGVIPSTSDSATTEDAAVMSDPAFATQAQRNGMTPEEYWQTLHPAAQQQHRDRIAGQRGYVPEPGVDLGFDRRAAANAAQMLDAGAMPDGTPISAHNQERLRLLIQERTPTEPDGTIATPAQPRAPQAGTAPQAPTPERGIGFRPNPAQPMAPKSPEEPESPVREWTGSTGIQPAPADANTSQPDAEPAGLGTRTSAQSRQVEASANTWVDEYRETGVPHIVEQLLRRGMVQEAQAYQDWASGERTEAGMRDYARAAMGAATGDFDLFAGSIIDLYNNEDYYGDGLTINRDNSDFIRDSDGNILGAEITFEDSDGNEFTRRWESLNELVDEALHIFSPERAFELQLARGDAAAQSQADAITADSERDMEFMEWMRKEVFKDQLSREQGATVEDALKAAQEHAMPGEWPQLSEDEKLDRVLEQVRLLERARATLSGVGGSTGSPPPNTDNVLRRP